MTFRYRKYQVYQEALEFHSLIVRITRTFPLDFDYLKKQVRRSSLSVMLNIAEGSGKNSDKDFRRYIGISLGSANETMSACEVGLKEKIINQQDFETIELRAMNIINQLGGFWKSLKN